MTYREAPSPPTLIQPSNSSSSVSTVPEFRLGTTDDSTTYVQYRIQVCSNSDCSSVVRTIDQTLSQLGWLSQGAQNASGYAVGSSITQYAIHQYQTPALSPNTQYWWRAQAIDPIDANSWSNYSTIFTFTTAEATRSQINIGGSTNIYGGVNFSTE